MSYEEVRQTPYIAKCACGKGFVRYYKVELENDWGQTREYIKDTTIHCDDCSKRFHIEADWRAHYLVPNGMILTKKELHLPKKYNLTADESFIEKYSKERIERIINDMTAPKHRYIKDLSDRDAINFAQEWQSRHRKKSLGPMVEFLSRILINYDTLEDSLKYKLPYVKKYREEEQANTREYLNTLSHSTELQFYCDEELIQNDIRIRDEYKRAHMYDDFRAIVSYDPSYRKDLTGGYWDTWYIEKCTDPQYLTLARPTYGDPKITILKKYSCVCSLCNRHAEVLSSDLVIENDDFGGYYPKAYCKCHNVSSFEAKTMDILNKLGVSYIREATFNGLVGETGVPLRFDFALYKSCNEFGQPIIDLVIELQGPHHFENGYYNPEGDFINKDIDDSIDNTVLSKQMRYDELKKQYCEKHSIDLKCVKYTNNSYEQIERKVISALRKNGYKYYADNQKNDQH